MYVWCVFEEVMDPQVEEEMENFPTDEMHEYTPEPREELINILDSEERAEGWVRQVGKGKRKFNIQKWTVS